MNITEKIIKKCIDQSQSRAELWIQILNSISVKNMAEVGVYRGYFASKILEGCSSIEKYYMIDPWRHLDNFVKPENVNDDMFEQFLSETKSKTDFAAGKRIILRGKTTEVIDQIPDGELDFAYIDGDHTLKGISIDLIRIFPKIKPGGWIGGDDFVKNLWQHTTKFEPTLVFPFAVYFAEAVGARIYSLPNSQFLIEKDDCASFEFIDLMGYFGDAGLINQFCFKRMLKLKLSETFPMLMDLLTRVKQKISKKKK
jgi:hypothetical protein